MPRANWLDWATMVLVIIGALNWGFVGLFGYNLVDALFGVMSDFSKIIYILVGLSGLYLLFMWVNKTNKV